MSRVLVVLEGTVVENVRLEELMIAKNQLQIVDAGYQELRMETPEWVTDKLTEVGHEITMRVRNELMRQLKAAKARRSNLMTADEKRSTLDTMIADLENKLK
jgi:hypothetical protein